VERLSPKRPQRLATACDVHRDMLGCHRNLYSDLELPIRPRLAGLDGGVARDLVEVELDLLYQIATCMGNRQKAHIWNRSPGRLRRAERSLTPFQVGKPRRRILDLGSDEFDLADHFDGEDLFPLASEFLFARIHRAVVDFRSFLVGKDDIVLGEEPPDLAPRSHDPIHVLFEICFVMMCGTECSRPDPKVLRASAEHGRHLGEETKALHHGASGDGRPTVPAC